MKTLIPVGLCVALAGLMTACSSHPKARELVSAAPPNAPAKASPAEVRDAYPVIGYLAGRENVITIKSGPQGPLYSVTTKDGRVLYEDLSAEQLQARAPDVFHVIKGSVANDARLRLDPLPGFPAIKMQVIDHDVLNRER